MIEIDEMLEQIEETALMLWKGEAQAYVKIGAYMGEWQVIIAQVLEEFAKRYQLDDKSLNVVVQQIVNLSEAIEKKDDCMLADTLEHELMNTLYYYEELACNNE